MLNRRLSIGDLTYALLVLGLLCLVFGWPISQLIGMKIQYAVFAATVCAVGLLNLRRPRSRWLYVYVGLYLVVAAVHVIQGSDLKPIMIASIYYLAIPLVFGQPLISGMRYANLMWLVALVAVPNAVAILLQMHGYTEGLLSVDRTITDGVVHDRFTGLMGSSLMLAQVSALGVVAAAHRGWVLRRAPVWSSAVFGMGVLCVVVSFSRLGYVVLFVGMATLLLHRVITVDFTRRNNWRTRIFAAAAAAAALAGVAIAGNSEALAPVAQRFASIGDFTGDEGNVLRAMYWMRAISMAVDNPVFGVGPGSLTSVGLERDTAADEATSPESYFLKVFAEAGLAFGVLFLLLVFGGMLYALRYYRRQPIMILPAAHFAQFAVAAIGIQLLEAPMMSAVFWLAFGIIMGQPSIKYEPRTRVKPSLYSTLPSSVGDRVAP